MNRLEVIVDHLKVIAKKHWLDIILAIVFFIIAFDTTISHGAFLFALSRKVALASAGLVYYYVTRLLKIGHVEWRDPYDKIYSIVLLIYVAVVFSLG